MKQSRIVLIAFSCFSMALGAVPLMGQEAKTLTLVATPGGKDAVVWNRKDAVDGNYGSATQFHAGTWTWNADNLGQGTFRSLIEFDLGAVPASATLLSAKLFLKADTLGFTKGHSSLSAGNAAVLYRVKEAWVESTVTWNTQPAVDTALKASLPQSANATQNYIVDVKDLVAAMLGDSIGNRGFLLRSVSETPYNDMAFASGDHADSTLRPSLSLEYEWVTTRLGGAAQGAREPLRYRMADGKLILSRAAAGQVLDLQGRIVARFGAAGVVALDGLKSGAYLLRTGADAAVFVLP